MFLSPGNHLQPVSARDQEEDHQGYTILHFEKNVVVCFKTKLVFNIHCRILKMLQDWASNTGGEARAMGMHAMNLAARSTSSRNLVDMLIDDVGK